VSSLLNDLDPKHPPVHHLPLTQLTIKDRSGFVGVAKFVGNFVLCCIGGCPLLGGRPGC
jgi:hypothetical protein